MAHDPGWDGTRTKTAICPVVSWIRTASNAYFPQVVSVLSLPDRGSGVETAVQEIWDLLQAVDSLESLSVFKRIPKVTERLAPYSNNEVLKAVSAAKGGQD